MWNFVHIFRPGGELGPGEDEIEGLKRLMTEVCFVYSNFVRMLLCFRDGEKVIYVEFWIFFCRR